MRTDKKDWSETSSYRWADPPPPLMGLLLFGKELLLFGNQIRNVSRKQNSIIHGGSKILIDSYRWGPPVFGPLLCPSLLLSGNRIRNVSQRQKASYIDRHWSKRLIGSYKLDQKRQTPYYTRTYFKFSFMFKDHPPALPTNITWWNCRGQIDTSNFKYHYLALPYVPGEIVGDNLGTELLVALELSLPKTGREARRQNGLLVVDSLREGSVNFLDSRFLEREECQFSRFSS